MSQFTKSVPMHGFGRQATVWAAAALLVGVIAAVALAIAVALGSFTGTAAPIADTSVPVTDSRLDDYGLRHPAPFTQPASSESRLDDYGLRHPAPLGQPASESRMDDYGLRHPAPFGGLENSGD